MSSSWLVPFANPGLDAATGVGGVPRGRLTTMLADPRQGSTGRTSAALMLIASEQAAGGAAAFIDASSQFDRLRAESFGIRSSELLLMIPSCLEEVVSCIFDAVKLGCSLVVVDEISDLAPLPEIQHPMEGTDSPSGRLLAHSMRQLRLYLGDSQSALVVLSSARTSIRGDHSFLVPAQGRSLLHYASMVLWFERMEDGFRTTLHNSKYTPPGTHGDWRLP